MKKILLISFLLLSITSVFASASSQSNCPQFYPQGIPYITSTKDVTEELCNSFFVVLYDTNTKANIFSAELLTPNKPMAKRVDHFHPDIRIEKGSRAELIDYLNHGYDKGHMVPAGDAATPQEMEDTFSLANMTPQDKILNEQPWKRYEMSVRSKATTGTTYILTGAVYSANPKLIGKDSIPVPSSYIKCVWGNNSGAECFSADNTDTGTLQPISWIQTLILLKIKPGQVK